MNFVQEQSKIEEPFYFENIFLKTLVLRMVLGVDDISHHSTLIYIEDQTTKLFPLTAW